jgi:hypothetical protein
LGSKQLRVPRWQVGPAGRARTSSASLSQSASTSSTRSTLPDSSPLRHRRPRERLKKCASPVESVRATAARSAQASISTAPLATSCTTTGSRPRSS